MAQKRPIDIIERSEGGDVEPALVFEDGGDHVNNQPWEHTYLHDGKRWVSGNFDTALADAATLVLVIEVGADKDAHMLALSACDGVSTLELLAITGLTAGTPLTPVNRNTNETSSSLVDITSQPSALADAAAYTPLVVVPGGTGGNASGGTSDSRDEIVLKANGKYAVRLTNISGNAKAASLLLDWYDHDPIPGVE